MLLSLDAPLVERSRREMCWGARVGGEVRLNARPRLSGCFTGSFASVGWRNGRRMSMPSGRAIGWDRVGSYGVQDVYDGVDIGF